MKGRRKLSTVRYKGLGADPNEIWCSVAVELRKAKPISVVGPDRTNVDSPFTVLSRLCERVKIELR